MDTSILLGMAMVVIIVTNVIHLVWDYQDAQKRKLHEQWLKNTQNRWLLENRPRQGQVRQRRVVNSTPLVDGDRRKSE